MDLPPVSGKVDNVRFEMDGDLRMAWIDGPHVIVRAESREGFSPEDLRRTPFVLMSSGDSPCKLDLPACNLSFNLQGAK